MTASGRSQFRRPESVLVVVYTQDLQVLLLERVAPEGFWQSVTGTLEWGEPADVAARRELFEETGIEAGDALVNCNRSYLFPILPAWRHRYSPDVIDNREYLYSIRLEREVPVRLNPAEHRQSVWLSCEEAANRVFSWTNREVIEEIAKGAGAHSKI
ncbi:MAG: dihydroneopterin triphosphate diphosphatase [Acidiferrobacteraceae bacterium]|jgi:dATP pyrophosphohydrolase|nr:dihydroneopterin triphosphate diphosphatase [Acidiferrobacteraceae bacterium]MDP6433906.1 dihydroneopterin triphosphate diphosphatase [Arenicellales bacterium]MDP6672633.1 dihydroneopterin triphosphate diphosphatase [Arenicellales bacterium]MDP6725123.1 dihydroneopterin triphosphate diphosphatase [Arenicellales bacterium]|tara:strand:- start:11486 stop:11956 length:471 start_codon:yes stop_codon:yes gene_type:complete